MTPRHSAEYRAAGSADAPDRGRPRRSAPRWVVVIVIACLALTAGLAASRLIRTQPSGPEVPGLTVGTTLTQSAADPWNPDSAVARARKVLSSVAPLQNQSIMGFGVLNPEPSPGEYDWSTLDQRMDAISATGAQPVLTLCCAPDWMKGGEAGETDWSRIEVAPTPDHYDDFAELAAEAAARYPQVQHFLVWNELKGFYDSEADDWDSAAYTDFYNRVYRAVKEVRPDALVGGPYVVFDSWSAGSGAGHDSDLRGPWGVVDQRSLDVVDYWLAHAAGADFIAVDGGTETRDNGLTTTDFQATGKLAAITSWVRSRTDLPIWWAEIYADTDDPDAPAGDPRRAAVMAAALVAVAKAGASVALVWQPQASASLASAALFSDTVTADGGRALPLARILAAVQQRLRDDPRKVESSWDESESTWTLTTDDCVITWSPDDGLTGPVANSFFRRLLS